MAISFTNDELDLLEQMLEAWQEGMGPARTETIADPTIENVDTLLHLASGLDEMDALAESIRKKVQRDRSSIWRSFRK